MYINVDLFWVNYRDTEIHSESRDYVESETRQSVFMQHGVNKSYHQK